MASLPNYSNMCNSIIVLWLDLCVRIVNHYITCIKKNKIKNTIIKKHTGILGYSKGYRYSLLMFGECSAASAGTLGGLLSHSPIAMRHASGQCPCYADKGGPEC